MSQQLAGKGAPVGGWKGEGQDLTWECGDKCREQFLRLTVDDWVWGDSHWFHGHCGLIQMWNPPYQAISRSSSGDACHHFRWWTWVWFGILFATLHGLVRNFQSPKSSGFACHFGCTYAPCSETSWYWILGYFPLDFYHTPITMLLPWGKPTWTWKITIRK